MSTIKMVTVLDKSQALTLRDNKRITGIDTMPQLDYRVKDFVKRYIARNVGYEDAPIAGLSRVYGAPAELRKVGTEVPTFIPGRSGTVLIEIHMPEEMIVSVPYEKLLDFSSSLKATDDEFEVEMILEDLEDEMVLGVPDMSSDEAISFISFIDVSKCKFLSVIDDNWETEEFNIPGIEKIKLASMSMF